MEDILYKLGIGAVIVILLFSSLRGCSGQSMTKKLGRGYGSYPGTQPETHGGYMEGRQLVVSHKADGR